MTVTRLAVSELDADDAEAMADLATLCDIAEIGAPDPEIVDWIRAGSGTSSFRAFGVTDDAGLAAFAYVECASGHTGLPAEVRVRPGLDLDLGVPLLARLRDEASAYDAAKPLHMFTNSGAGAQRRWWERQGAHQVRRFQRMTIDLGETRPAVPQTPDDVVLRAVRDEEADLRTVQAVIDASFAEHFGHSEGRAFDEWIEKWRRREGFDLSLWWVAERAGAAVSVLLGQTIAGAGHVSTLGTLRHARGAGLGTLLLRTSFAQFHDRGLRRVSLGVDSENSTGAVKLYESVGMHATADWALYELPPDAQGPAGSTRSDSNAT